MIWVSSVGAMCDVWDDLAGLPCGGINPKHRMVFAMVRRLGMEVPYLWKSGCFFWYKFALNSPFFFCQVGRGACQRFIVPSSHMYSNYSVFSFANLETYITNTKFRIFMSLETIGHIKHKNLWLRNDMVDFINKNWGRTETRLHVPIWVLVKKTTYKLFMFIQWN